MLTTHLRGSISITARRVRDHTGPDLEASQSTSMKVQTDNSSARATIHKMQEPTDPVSCPIAIVGMACRFAGGVHDPETLWALVSQGKGAWSTIPEGRFHQPAFYHEQADMTGSVSEAALLSLVCAQPTNVILRKDKHTGRLFPPR